MPQQPVGFFYAIPEYRIVGRVVYVGFHHRAVLPDTFDVLDARVYRYFVQFDKQFNCLTLNPGASGIYGFHQMRTMLRFEIDMDKIENLEVIELGIR